MSKQQIDILEYIICCVGAFAERFSLTNRQAYKYLQQYEGLLYLMKHYNIVHTFSIDDAVEDCARICQRHEISLTRNASCRKSSMQERLSSISLEQKRQSIVLQKQEQYD